MVRLCTLMQTAGACSGGGVVNFPMLVMLLLYTEHNLLRT